MLLYKKIDSFSGPHTVYCVIFPINRTSDQKATVGWTGVLTWALTDCGSEWSTAEPFRPTYTYKASIHSNCVIVLNTQTRNICVIIADTTVQMCIKRR